MKLERSLAVANALIPLQAVGLAIKALCGLNDPGTSLSLQMTMANPGIIPGLAVVLANKALCGLRVIQA